MSGYSWVNACFSPAGTTAKVARAVAEGSGCRGIYRMDGDTPCAGCETGQK